MSSAVDRPPVAWLARIDRSSLALVGGKAANLGEMAAAGLSVPPGFCITTAAYALLATAAGLEPVVAALEATAATETGRLAQLEGAARAALLSASVPVQVEAAVRAAYAELSGEGEPVPVAVRSSATSEDLPEASFAGQQDTYLGVVGGTRSSPPCAAAGPRSGSTAPWRTGPPAAWTRGRSAWRPWSSAWSPHPSRACSSPPIP